MRHFFGIPDEEFIRGDVPMTKCEIRKAVMNEARIEENSIVLDVGADAGSISIEAALAALKDMYMQLSALIKASILSMRI